MERSIQQRSRQHLHRLRQCQTTSCLFERTDTYCTGYPLTSPLAHFPRLHQYSTGESDRTDFPFDLHHRISPSMMPGSTYPTRL